MRSRSTTPAATPTRHAFERGGCETSFGPASRLASEAGDLLADAALALIRERTTG